MYFSFEQVRALFSSKLEGGDTAVEGVRLVRDKETLVGKGFGYVLLADRALAASVSNEWAANLSYYVVGSATEFVVFSRISSSHKSSPWPQAKAQLG